MPNRSDNYQLQSWPPTPISRELWNAVMADIASRLTNREALEASFELLQQQGVQAALDYIQVTVAPQVSNLQALIVKAQDQINQIFVDGAAPNALKLGGKTPDWYLGKSGGTVEGKLFIQAGAAGIGDGAIETRPYEGDFSIRGNGKGPALMSFHRPGAYAVHFGLDTDNQLKIGGWSMGAKSYRIWHSGNLDPANLVADTTISKNTPTLNLFETGLGATWKIQHGGGGNLRFDNYNSYGVLTVSFMFKSTGEIWTSQIGDLKTALDGKLSTAGGGMTGPVSITSTGGVMPVVIMMPDAGAYGKALRLGTGSPTSDGFQNGPQINFLKYGRVQWALGINHGKTNADHFVLMLDGHESSGGTQKLSIDPNGLMYLASGGMVYANGDVFHSGYGVTLTALTDRARKVRLGAELFQNVNINGWNIVPGGGAITALYRGGGGQIEGMNYRMLQQTDLFGNWYNVGTS